MLAGELSGNGMVGTGNKEAWLSSEVHGAASVARERTDVEGLGRKRRFQALLLHFLW